METYLMSYDDSGNILTFYPQSIIDLYLSIPEKTIRIDEKIHQEVLKGGYRVDINTKELVKEVI